jgi:predicted transcriptional regulator of viral defense system
MRVKSKYQSHLTFLLQRSSFTAAEAAKVGVPRRMLSYLVAQGDLERLGRGVYRSTSFEWEADATLEEVAIAAATVPNAVICLVSALKYYELTEEIVRQHWIAIPNKQWARTPLPYMRVVRMRNISLGRREIRIGDCKVAIFDRERCIVDAFRYLSREIAIKALKAYLLNADYKPDVRRLVEYAKKLRVNLDTYLISLTT